MRRLSCRQRNHLEIEVSPPKKKSLSPDRPDGQTWARCTAFRCHASRHRRCDTLFTASIITRPKNRPKNRRLPCVDRRHAQLSCCSGRALSEPCLTRVPFLAIGHQPKQTMHTLQHLSHKVHGTRFGYWVLIPIVPESAFPMLRPNHERRPGDAAVFSGTRQTRQIPDLGTGIVVPHAVTAVRATRIEECRQYRHILPIECRQGGQYAAAFRALYFLSLSGIAPI